MPLFSRKEPEYAAPTYSGADPRSSEDPRFGATRSSVDHSPKRGGLFHRRPSPTPDYSDDRYNGMHSSDRASRRSGGGIFSRSSRSSSLSSSDYEGQDRNSTGRSSRRNGGGMFGGRRSHEDPSIVAAHERLAGAERAEQQADRAVMEARAAVSEAREHVKRLEHEGKEDARLAKIKQRTAKSLGKQAKPLGRY